VEIFKGSVDMTEKTRILIVDDCSTVLKDLRTVLELTDGIVVAGAAASGEEAIRQADMLKPDIVVLDLEMPGMGGLATMRRIHAEQSAGAVFVLTVHGYASAELAARDAGADGFFVKGRDLEILLERIQNYRQTTQQI